MKKQLMALLSLLLAFSAAADTWTDPATGIVWTYTVSDGEATIEGNGTDIQGSIEIPSSLNGYTVTSIGDSAFMGCSGLTSVTIPNGVTSVGDRAFKSCSGLTSVTIPSSVTNIGTSAFVLCGGLTSVTIPNGMTSIGDRAFKSCSGLMSVTIPSSVTSIGEEAFYDCSGLTSVTIPSSVTSIGWSAFYGCSGLTSVTIPSGVTEIGLSVFYGCSGLRSVTIPSSVTSIDCNAFYGCSGLTSVTIPSSVTEIHSGAFYGCSGLTSVTIPSSVMGIGGDAFYECYGLAKIIVDAANSCYTSRDGILYDKELWTLICCPAGKTGSVTIPSSVMYIGASAFHGCRGLTKITVDADNPDYTSQNGILYDKELRTLICCPAGKTGSVTIPSSVTRIGEWAFYGCSGLTSVTIPSSVTSVGIEAFYECDGLKKFVVDADNTTYCSMNGLLLSKDKKTLILGVNGNVTIPSSVTSIGDSAFCGCSGLTSVTIPSSVTGIGSCAFYGCSGLNSVTIPSSVTSIGSCAFYECDGLTTVYVSEGDVDRVKILLYNSVFNFDNVEVVEKKETPTYTVIVGAKASVDVGLKGQGYSTKTLPKGLTYSDKTGLVTGTCKTATAAEGVEVTFTKKNAENVVVNFVVRKENEPTVACAELTNGTLTVGVSCGGLIEPALPTIPLTLGAESGIKSVTATKLPTGMKIASSKDKTSWYITGAPTKAGTYEVAITLTTAAGNKVTEKFTVTVAALPSGATGTFNGFVLVDANFCSRQNEDETSSVGRDQKIASTGATLNYGTVQVTVSDVGKITAKVIAAADTYSFTATGWDSANESVYSVEMTTKKGDVLTLACDSIAAWNAKQMTGTFSPVDANFCSRQNEEESSSVGRDQKIASTYAVEAQKNAFGKQWFFNAELTAREGTSSTEDAEAWTLSFAENAKSAALTVTLNADGKTAIAGTLYGAPVTDGKKTTTPSYKVSASGYADVSGIGTGAIFADFAPVISVKSGKTTIKKVLSLRANLWFDKKNDHEEGVGSAVFVP